jgi:hypothetical protein
MRRDLRVPILRELADVSFSYVGVRRVHHLEPPIFQGVYGGFAPLIPGSDIDLLFEYDRGTVLEKVVERLADRYDVGRSALIDDQKDRFGHRVAIVIAEFVIQIVSCDQYEHYVQGIVDLGRAEEPFDVQKGLDFDDGWLEDQFEYHVTKVAEVALIGGQIQELGHLLGCVFLDHAVQDVCENRHRMIFFGFQEFLLHTHVDIEGVLLDGRHLACCLFVKLQNRVSIFFGDDMVGTKKSYLHKQSRRF